MEIILVDIDESKQGKIIDILGACLFDTSYCEDYIKEKTNAMKERLLSETNISFIGFDNSTDFMLKYKDGVPLKTITVLCGYLQDGPLDEKIFDLFKGETKQTTIVYDSNDNLLNTARRKGFPYRFKRGTHSQHLQLGKKLIDIIDKQLV